MSAIQRKNNILENQIIIIVCKKYFSGYFCNWKETAGPGPGLLGLTV